MRAMSKLARPKHSDSGERHELGKASEKMHCLSIFHAFFWSLFSALLPYSSHLSPLLLSERPEQAMSKMSASIIGNTTE